MDKLYADIVLLLASPGPLQFSVPVKIREEILPGHRVRVPLRNRSAVGYVAGFSDAPRVKGIKPVEKILDPEPQLPEELLQLLLWVAEHYLAPPGLVFRAALPRAIHLEGTSRATARDKTSSHFSLNLAPHQLRAVLPDLERRSPAQAAILRLMAEERGSAPASSFSRSALRSLINKGWIRTFSRPVRRGLIQSPSPTAMMPALTPPQAEALKKIRHALTRREFAPFLLHGVTGSGKTEVYTRAVQELPPDRQAIVLVPEVSLTVQVIRHFQERLSLPLAVWHHQLAEGEKHDLWKLMRRGEVRVVIGARSAVFSPLPRLGLLIIDEEQEGSFKQENVPCYHAREVALQRAALSGATIIMGSATPCLESYHRAVRGEFTLLTLPERFGGRPLPEVELLDLKEPRDSPGASTRTRGRAKKPSLFSESLITAAAEELQAGNQVLFFLNRRGYAPFTHCRECGWAMKCPNCLVSLVFHAQGGILLCHYCGYRIPPPELCPSCGGTELRLSGSGTQRLESEIRKLFPDHRVSRLDRDTASRKGAGGDLATAFESGQTDILVGTQLAAKGWNFPRLTMVGVLNPDLSLNLPDFRAAERTFQLVSQVAGRAGRGEKPGKVLIQTYQPEHYALQAAGNHDYCAFYRQELDFRRELDFPPFHDLVLLRVEGPTLERLEERADDISRRVRDLLDHEILAGRCRVFGPVPAPLQKIKNRFRYQILVKTQSLEGVIGILRGTIDVLYRLAGTAHCRLLIDVNPVSLM